MEVPTEALENLSCHICKNTLSYFPIRHHSNLGPICGRCKPPDSDYFDNFAYEILAATLKFPCRFSPQGCLEILQPDQIIEHEKSCHYMTIDCPMKKTDDCPFNGTMLELISHFEEKHPFYVLENANFEIELLNSYEKNYLLQFVDESFILHVEFNSQSNLLSCSVVYVGFSHNSDHFNYKLILQNSNKSRCIEFAECPTVPLDRKHVTEVSVDHIRERLDDPSTVIGRIDFIEIDLLPKEKSKLEPTPSETLKIFECPICFDYMHPIFMCENSHGICGNCKPKREKCCLCDAYITDKRNLQMEQLIMDTPSFIFPCRNFDFGCGFTGKFKTVRDHQKYCLYGLHDCPVKDYENCDSKIVINKMFKHVREIHHDFLLEIDTISLPIDENYYDNEDEFCYILKCSMNLFKLHYAYRNGKFFWAMQLFGTKEKAKKFSYEIDIFDNSKSNLRVYIKGTVCELTHKLDAFNDKQDFISLYREQVEDMITDNFVYRVRILKK